MSKFGIVRATALSLALAVATPAFAVGLRNVGGAMHVGNGGFRGAQASIGSVGTSAADASYCRQRWAYYDPVARKYMGDDGEWRSCPAGSAAPSGRGNQASYAQSAPRFVIRKPAVP